MSSPPSPPARLLVTYSARLSGVGIEWCSPPGPLMFGLRFSAAVHLPSTRREVQMLSPPCPPGGWTSSRPRSRQRRVPGRVGERRVDRGFTADVVEIPRFRSGTIDQAEAAEEAARAPAGRTSRLTGARMYRRGSCQMSRRTSAAGRRSGLTTISTRRRRLAACGFRTVVRTEPEVGIMRIHVDRVRH